MPAAPFSLPRWTWWLPLPVLHLATWLSLATQFSTGAALWHLPFALSLVMSLWWGPRVLVLLYLNAMLSIPLWGLDWRLAPLYALPETIGVALAWLLLRLQPIRLDLAHMRHLLRFMLLGVLLPLVPVALGVQSNLWLSGQLELAQLLPASLTLWLADCLTTLAVATPLLVCLSPWLRRRGWLLEDARVPIEQPAPGQERLPPWPLLGVLLLGLPWLLGLLPLSLNLQLIGVMLLVLALGWRFAGALCGALLSTLMVLLLPLLQGLHEVQVWLDPQRQALHLSVLLFVIATLLVGRALSDLRLTLAGSARVQEQLALAKLAVESSPLGVLIIEAGPEQRLTYCNAAFTRISGYSLDDIRGRRWDLILGNDLQQRELAQVQRALQQGQPCEAVLRTYRKGGTQFWSELVLAPMLDGSAASHFVMLLQDVSSREALAEQVREQREESLRQSHLFSQTEDIANLGGWVLYMADRSMSWSPGCFRIYELDPKNGAPDLNQAMDYLDASGRLLLEETLQRLLKGQDSFDIEVRLLTALGKSRWVRIRGIAEHDGATLVRVFGALQDISARKLAEQQLRERDERLQLFFEAPLIGMALTGPSFEWEEVNQKLCSILGRSREELRQCNWASLSQTEQLATEQALLGQIHAGEREGYELDKCLLRADGSEVQARVSVQAVRHASGRVRMFLLLVEDISERYQAEARYRTMIEHAPEAIVLFSPLKGMVDCNENAVRLFGYSREALYGKSLLELSPVSQPDGRNSQVVADIQLCRALAGEVPVFEWLHRDSAGRQIPCEVRLVRMPGEPALIRGSITDISERQRYQHEIERLAYSDELTGLPNRRLLLDRLQHAMDRELRDNTLGALLFIDLDHFKTVNDSLGHLIGDALLREVTTRLAQQLRVEDTLARMGGDEFVVLLEGLDSSPQVAAEHAAGVGEKLLKCLNGCCWIEGHELSISASIGIALHPFGARSAADVLKQADTAMYRAKHSGRNALHFFAPEMQAVIDQRLQLQSELRQALVRNQLYLVFQPQLALATGRVAGAEVLLRWRHPERGEVMPGDFIALAEETGLIEEVGAWVLEQACDALARWLPSWPQLVLAVNLSPRELRQPGCVNRVQQCLQRHKVPATALELEITEGVLVEDVQQCIANMQALKAIGIRFAIDDFGTGYSSLTYLKRLPLDRLKIDRSFTWDMDSEDGSGLMLVQTILVIARNLGLECVAEGIENQWQLDCLRQHGCSLGQGYHLSRPLTEQDFLAWMAEQHR